MALYTSPAAGGLLPTNPVFTGLVTGDAFAATDGGPPGRSGSFRTGSNIDVLVARDAGDTVDVPLLSVLASNSMQLANPATVSYLVINQFSGGVVYQRFAGVDTIATFATHVERSQPENGGDPTFAPSPYGTDGLVDVANVDADFDETPDHYRFRKLSYVNATTAPRTVSFPAATSDAGYYEKTIRNLTGNNLTVNTVGSLGFGVTIATNKTAIVGFTRFVASRVSADA